MRLLNLYPLGKFQVYHTVWWPRVTTLYIRPSGGIPLTAESFCAPTNLSAFHPLPDLPVPGDHPSTLRFYEYDFLKIPPRSDTVYYLCFSVWLISLCKWQDFLLCKGWIIVVCVCVCVCPHFFYPFIKWRMLRLFPYLDYLTNAAMNTGV